MKNAKLFLLAGLTAFALALSFAFWLYLSPKDFEYEVEFCKEAEVNETLLKNRGIQKLETFCDSSACNVSFTILDAPYCNANARNFKVKYAREKDTLYVVSVFSDITATKCVCPVKIKGKIRNLPRGNYKLVYIFDNKYAKTKKIVDEKELRVEKNE